MNEIELELGCDEIDESICKCFLVGKSWCEAESMTKKELKLSDRKRDEIYFSRRERMQELLSEECAKRGGKLYQSKAKAAKWAIMGTVWKWDKDIIEDFRAQGYRVTILTAALRYLAIDDCWECATQEAHYVSQRDFKKSEDHGKPIELSIRSVYDALEKEGTISTEEKRYLTEKAKNQTAEEEGKAMRKKGIFSKLFGK